MDKPPHRRMDQEEGDRSVPEVHFDYAYVRRDEDAPITLLIAKHRQSKMPRA